MTFAKTALACAFAAASTVSVAHAKPLELTGLACERPTQFGTQTWEFYGDVAIRYYEDGSVSRLPRVGDGAYERYDREGNWTAIYFFFEQDNERYLRILSRPGRATRAENKRAPMEGGVFPFNGECVSLEKT